VSVTTIPIFRELLVDSGKSPFEAPQKNPQGSSLEFFAGFSDVQKGLFATKFAITLYYSPLNVKEIVYLDCLKLVATERLNTKGHPSLVRYGHYFHRLFEDSRRLTVGSNLITWRILEQGA
jgi:hypothetical protein